jgi:hypothetical protein
MVVYLLLGVVLVHHLILRSHHNGLARSEEGAACLWVWVFCVVWVGS